MKKRIASLLLVSFLAGMALAASFASPALVGGEAIAVSWCSDDPGLVDYFRFPPMGERHILVCLEVQDGDIPAADIEAALDAFVLMGLGGLTRTPVAWRAYTIEETGDAYAPSAAQRSFGLVYSIPEETHFDDLALQISLLSGVTYAALKDVLHMAYASPLSK